MWIPQRKAAQMLSKQNTANNQLTVVFTVYKHTHTHTHMQKREHKLNIWAKGIAFPIFFLILFFGVRVRNLNTPIYQKTKK